jgi:hypothetical protein
MKLKPGVRIAAGWARERLWLDVLETLWMSVIPLVCGIMFGVSSNLIWLVIGIIPLFVKFIYKRETEGTTIYLR